MPGMQFLVFNLEAVEQSLEVIQGGKTGAKLVAFDAGPLTETSIIEHIQVVGDDEGDGTSRWALLDHNQSTYTTIIISEWINCLEALMDVDIVLKGAFLDGIMLLQQFFNLLLNISRYLLSAPATATDLLNSFKIHILDQRIQY